MQYTYVRVRAQHMIRTINIEPAQTSRSHAQFLGNLCLSISPDLSHAHSLLVPGKLLKCHLSSHTSLRFSDIATVGRRIQLTATVLAKCLSAARTVLRVLRA